MTDEIDVENAKRLKMNADILDAASWRYTGWGYEGRGPEYPPQITSFAEHWGEEGNLLIYIEEGLEDSNALQFAAEVVAAYGRGDLIDVRLMDDDDLRAENKRLRRELDEARDRALVEAANSIPKITVGEDGTWDGE